MAYRPEMKAEPLAHVMSCAMPKELTQSLSALEQMADASTMGITSGHLVEQSLEMKNHLAPSDRRRGLTMPTWR